MTFSFVGDKRGVDGKKVVDGILKGTGAMYASDGETTNEERFWRLFLDFMDEEREWEALFQEFYETRFVQLRAKTSVNPLVEGIVKKLHDKGYRLVLTTNPLFPHVAAHQRLSWTGADPAHFERITTYENSRFAKPSPHYYVENLAACGLSPQDVLMVGNDTRDDGIASTLGIDVYIVTDCLETHAEGCVPLEELRHGTMEEFSRFVDELPDAEA